MSPATFDEYSTRYKCARMRRADGILEITLHTDDGSLSWGATTKTELTYLFADVGNDADNRVIILTGTGDSFIRPGFVEKAAGSQGAYDPERWGRKNHFEGKKLLSNHLEIPVPMIAAVNGPSTMHGEIALLCDIVLASEDAAFQDALHFRKGVIPGDGAHIVWPVLLGMNRARYFLLTGQVISAEEALRLGVVNEVLPKERLMDRARELARDILQRPPLAVQLFRETTLQPYKRLLAQDLGYGLALEGLSAASHWPF